MVTVNAPDDSVGMIRAATLETPSLSRGGVTAPSAPRVLVVSSRDDLRWLLGPLGETGLEGATVKRTSVLPGAEALPDLLVLDGRGEAGLVAAWRKWLAGPGTGTPAVIVADGGAALDAPASAVVAPVDASPGRLAAAIATAFERGRAQSVHAQLAQRASRAERRLAALLEHSPETFGLLDRSGRFTYASPIAARVHGDPPTELFGKELVALLHPDDQDRARAELAAVLSAPRAFARMTVRRRHPRGHAPWIELTVTNLLAEPTVEAVVASFHDVDEGAATITTARASDQRFQQLAEELPIALWSMGAEHGTLDYVSPHAAVLVGRSAERLQADPALWRAAIHPDDRGAVEAAHASGVAIEHRWVRPDGSVVWVESQQQPIADAQGQVVRVVGVAHEISERRALEARLDGACRVAPLALLAGITAHDLNNIVGGLQIQCDLLLDGQLSAEAREDVASLLELGQRTTVMSRRLLEHARRFPATPTPIDVGAVVRRLVPSLVRLVGPAIAIDVAIDPALPRIVADPAHLEHALIHLAMNARDAMPAGGRLRLAARTTAGKVVISVTDDGVGMDEPTCKQAPVAFFTTRPGQRTGMGLAVVSTIARQHQGNLRLVSTPGQGTTASLELPAAP